MRHLAQTVRFFCTWCAPRGISLLLMADEAGEAAAEMLREAEAAVGLPPIVWVAEDEKSRDALLAFSGDGHGAPIARALPLERYPSKPELEAALQSYAARTPIGRLQLCSTLPWYALPYEHARVREALRIFNASAAEE